MPSGVYERKPKDPAKVKARRVNGAGGSYEALLTQLRVERERLVDKVTALGTAIEALEALA